MPFEIKPATREGPRATLVPLTKGLSAFVDIDDLPLVAGWKWYAMRSKATFYAARNSGMINGVRGDTILMHRVIASVQHSQLVDHEDGNGLNNRRSNLRPASRQQNAANSIRKTRSTSTFKWVSWSSDRRKWLACIVHNGRTKNLGRFDSEKDAANAYNVAAIAAYGEFAYLNKP